MSLRFLKVFITVRIAQPERPEPRTFKLHGLTGRGMTRLYLLALLSMLECNLLLSTGNLLRKSRDLGLALLLGDGAEEDVHRLEGETIALGEKEGGGEGDDVEGGEEEQLWNSS